MARDHVDTMTLAPDRRPQALDTWMALLAGDRVWYEDEGVEPSTRERAASAFMVTAIALTILVQWIVLATRVDVFALGTPAHDRELEKLATAGSAAAVLLAIRPLRLALGHRPPPANFWWSLCWRTAAYLTMIAATAALFPRFRVLGAVPLGLVGGADAILTMWTLGLSPRPLQWLKRLLLSAVHFGALGALIGTVVFDRDGPSPRTALGIYLAMWAGLAVAGIAVLSINRLSALVDEARDADREEIRSRERELRVHWLHDDVLSEVKLAALRLETESDLVGAQRELQELDHRLRMRQLEESIRGGRPHLYEIIQPHLRRAQTLGVRVTGVPALDRTDRRVDEATGQLVHRVVSNLMSNAINAGARQLQLALEESLDGSSITIAVTDDAGGFSLADVPPGRGLALLFRDFGDDAVRRIDAPGGSTVSVRVPLAPPAARPTAVEHQGPRHQEAHPS